MTQGSEHRSTRDRNDRESPLATAASRVRAYRAPSESQAAPPSCASQNCRTQCDQRSRLRAMPANKRCGPAECSDHRYRSLARCNTPRVLRQRLSPSTPAERIRCQATNVQPTPAGSSATAVVAGTVVQVEPVNVDADTHPRKASQSLGWYSRAAWSRRGLCGLRTARRARRRRDARGRTAAGG